MIRKLIKFPQHVSSIPLSNFDSEAIAFILTTIFMNERIPDRPSHSFESSSPDNGSHSPSQTAIPSSRLSRSYLDNRPTLHSPTSQRRHFSAASWSSAQQSASGSSRYRDDYHPRSSSGDYDDDSPRMRGYGPTSLEIRLQAELGVMTARYEATRYVPLCCTHRHSSLRTK